MQRVIQPRCEDYSSVTGSVRFPLYISKRLENVPVIDRAL